MRLTPALFPLIALLVGCSPSDDSAAVTDSGPCSAGQVYTTYWDQPGCDRPASHRCKTPGEAEDACATVVCGCDGKTVYGACGYASEPFASLGPCEVDDAATDAPADATVDVSAD
jgi:hypothetical protein